MQILPINNLRRSDGKVGAGVYVAYQRRLDPIMYIRMWIGTNFGGPCLQYDFDGADKWDGEQRRDFANGAWTPCYSHGNFGRNYACGGTWSGHSINVAGLPSKTVESKSNLLVCNAGKESVMVQVPDGITPDIVCNEIEPKDSWAIWYTTAPEALAARLTSEQAQSAILPDRAKKNMKQENIAAVKEVLEAYRL